MENLEELITGKKDLSFSTLARVETLIMTTTGDRESFERRMLGLTTEEDARKLMTELEEQQPIPGREMTPHTLEDQGRAIMFAADLDDFKEQRGKMEVAIKEVDPLARNLNAIRAALDTNTEGVDIDSVVELGKRLSALIGLSAECKAQARKKLDAARLTAINLLNKKDTPPSVMLKTAESMCGEEAATYEYADRLNAGIIHQLDFFRSCISLHKSEMENSMK